MELLEGETLSARLKRAGRMSLAQALPLARSVDLLIAEGVDQTRGTAVTQELLFRELVGVQIDATAEASHVARWGGITDLWCIFRAQDNLLVKTGIRTKEQAVGILVSDYGVRGVTV